MLEEEIMFDYNIQTTSMFNINVESNPNCPICKNVDIAKESAPFFYSTIPNDVLVEFMKEKYGLDLIEKDIEEHRTHVKLLHDEELQRKISEDYDLIDGDKSKKTNDDTIIESSIRALYARRLFLEKKSEFGKEWLETTDKLKGWIELKLKKEKKIDDNPEFSVSFGDLLKLDTDDGGKNNDDDKGEKDLPEKRTE